MAAPSGTSMGSKTLRFENYAGRSARVKKFQTLLAKEMLTLLAQHPDLQEAQSNVAKASQALEAQRAKR